ncbi:MAG: type IV secretion system DNA-binding domain-containing protein [Gammaproteobacteria bacterium]
MTRKRTKIRLDIGGLPIPLRYEVLHFLISGSTGSGKSQLLARLLLTLSLRRAWGDRCIVIDPGTSLAPHFLLPGDCILNPLDKRALPWSPLAEMQSPNDAPRIARSIIPDPPSPSDRSWYGYARQLLAATLVHVWECGGDNGDLLDLLTLASRADDLCSACAGTPASILFLQGNEKMRANSQGVLSPYLAAFTYLPRRAGSQSFALRKWANQQYTKFQKGWLWWPVPTNQLDVLAPLIATQVAALTTAVLQLPEDRSRRMFVVADEFAQLGKVASIEQALTLGRKHGLVAVLAIQSIAQLRQIYGHDGAQVLLSCLSNWVILRSADAETAEAMSRHVGDHEVQITERSEGESGNYGDGRSQRSRSITLSEHRRVERALLASQIQRLPERQAIITLADRPEAIPVTIPLVTSHLPRVTSGFVTRPLKKPPQPDARTPTPASPVSGGDETCSPTSRTSSANPMFTAATAASSIPPSPGNIALDDLLASKREASQDSLSSPSESLHQTDSMHQNPAADDSATS